MILANGCPKSGTHALMAMLAKEGGKRVPGLMDGLHDRRPLKLRGTPSDPSPVTWGRALSLDDGYFLHAHVRSAHARELPGFRVITIFRDPRNVLVSYMRWKGLGAEAVLRHFLGRPFVEVYRGFLGWGRHGEWLRYEDIGIVAGPPGYENAERANSTWTGAPSDWRDYWTDRVARAWRAAGGDDLVAEAGYS